MQRPSFALLMLCGALALGLTVADRTNRPKLASKARARSVARVTKAILPKPRTLPSATTVPAKIATASTELTTTIPTASTAALPIASPAFADAVVAVSAGEDRTDTIPSWLLTGDEDPVDFVGSKLVDGGGASKESAASPSTAEVTTATANTAEPTPTESPVAELTATKLTATELSTVGATEAGAGSWSLTAWVVQRFADQRSAVLGVEVHYSIPKAMKRLSVMASVVDRMSERLLRASGEMFEAATRPTTAPQAGG